MADTLRESDRNALLRRVDWRFLLDLEEQPTSVCFASGRLARAVELVSARRSPDASPVDLAVLVNPTRRKLAAARAELRPGGELYAEWYLPRPGGHARAKRKLESLGFTDVRCYWPWPWPTRGGTSFWLPLDAPEAIDGYLRSRPRGRGGRPIGDALWRALERLGLLVPICTVARKPGAGERPDRLASLLLTGGARSVNKAVALEFERAASAPSIAVKFARSASEDEPLRREAATLQLVRETRPALSGVPEVRFLGTRAGCLALAETVVAGRPIMFRLSRSTLGTYADAVTDRLSMLAGAPAPAPREAWWPRLVEEPLREFERGFDSVVDAAQMTRAREAIATVGAVPPACEHRDCSPWNVLVTDEGEVAFVDWESSEPNGLAGLDLVYFLTHAALFVDGALTPAAARPAYAAMLDPETPTGRVTDRCIERYCARVGLDAEFLGPLRLLCWTLHARSEHRRLAADGRSLRESLFLALWEEELRRLDGQSAS